MRKDDRALTVNASEITKDDVAFGVNEIRHDGGVATIVPEADVGYERVDVIRPEDSSEFLRRHTSIEEKLDEAGIEGDCPETRLNELWSYTAAERMDDPVSRPPRSRMISGRKSTTDGQRRLGRHQ